MERWTGHVVNVWEVINAYEVLITKSEKQDPV
jgi:hypothetical protein